MIVRRERPHPGAQLRFTDADGHRFTAFITDTNPGGPRRQHADLEIRHRSHARVEDRIRCGKATGLRNLPCRGYEQNRVWLELALTAADLLTWTQALCLDGDLARCEPDSPALPAAARRSPTRPHRQTMAPQDRQRLALGHSPGHRLRPTARRALASPNLIPTSRPPKEIGEAGTPADQPCPPDTNARREDQLREPLINSGGA